MLRDTIRALIFVLPNIYILFLGSIQPHAASERANDSLKRYWVFDIQGITVDSMHKMPRAASLTFGAAEGGPCADARTDVHAESHGRFQENTIFDLCSTPPQHLHDYTFPLTISKNSHPESQRNCGL